MADNVTANSGTGGATFAADDILGVHYPRTKITIGADGSNDGDVSSANPLPVSDAGGSLTVDGTLAVTNAGLTELAAAINASSQMDVNIAASGATVTVTGAGGTFPVTDSAGSLTVDAPVGTPVFVRLSDGAAAIAALPITDNAGSLTVDGTVTANLAAGTNNIGDVDVLSIAAGDNNIGNVDIVTVPTDPFGANADAASATGSISAKLRFIASTGIPITGTVTVGSHAVTNAGTFAVQESGTHVLTDDAAFTPGTTKVVMAGAQADETATDSVDEGDGGALRMTLDRKLINNPQPHTAGGLSIFQSLDIDETEEDVKTSAGQVYGYSITNRATATRYVKFYNATAATVVVGTTTPVMTLGIPGNSSDATMLSAAFGGMGIAFGTAITVAATTGFADNDTGAPGANDVLITVFYK